MCVCVFALACHSLKDDHSIVNKQDICLKSCITSGEDSQEMRCAMLTVQPCFREDYHLKSNKYFLILHTRDRHRHTHKLCNNISLFVRQSGLKRSSGSICHQRGSPQPSRQPQRHQRPTVSLDTSAWQFHHLNGVSQQW